MSRWFRMHDELLDDPKVQKLSAADFKGWVNLLCLASKNGGRLPQLADIAFALRETPDAVSTLLERLLNGGLIECRSGGADGKHYAPYRWEERQYKSDTSTERVKRFRKRSETVTETPPDTETDTEEERSSEPKGSSPVAGFAFRGKTIRLNAKDFAAWQKDFHGIPDLRAELIGIDGWLQEQDEKQRKRWFHSVPGMLSRKHQEMLKPPAAVDPVAYRQEPMRV